MIGLTVNLDGFLSTDARSTITMIKMGSSILKRLFTSNGCDCGDTEIKKAEIIPQKKFNAKANKKNVKTRTQYKFVDEYEKDFKREFGKTIGNMSKEFVTELSKTLKLTK